MLKANLKSSKNYDGEDFLKLQRALQLIENTINGEVFKSKIVNFQSFQFVKYKCFLGQRARTINLREYTNAEIFAILIAGHRSDCNDTFMDLQLILSEGNGRSAIGETDGDDVTTTYRGAFERMSDGELAAHLTHEWTHTLGFEHSFSDGCDPGRNCFSVPYAVGNIIEIITTGECWYGCAY